MKFQILRSPTTARPYFWRIVGADGRMITFSSKLHEDKDECMSEMWEVMREAAKATIEDLTEAGPVEP